MRRKVGSENAGEHGVEDSPSRTFRPTEDTLKHFPAVTASDVARWDLRRGVSNIDEVELSFEALRLVFPKKAVDLIVEKVSTRGFSSSQS